MTTSLQTTIKASLLAQFSNILDLGTAKIPLTKDLSLTFSNGTGANKAQAVFADNRSLAASASEDLDLSGALVDVYGNTISFATIKAILVVADSTNGSTLSIGGAATNAFVNWVANASDIVKIRSGGFLLLAAPDVTGYPVTAGTGDLLHIANDDAGAGAIYDIMLIGE